MRKSIDAVCRKAKHTKRLCKLGLLLPGGVAVRVNDLPLADIILVQRRDALPESVYLL